MVRNWTKDDIEELWEEGRLALRVGPCGEAQYVRSSGGLARSLRGRYVRAEETPANAPKRADVFDIKLNRIEPKKP